MIIGPTAQRQELCRQQKNRICLKSNRHLQQVSSSNMVFALYPMCLFITVESYLYTSGHTSVDADKATHCTPLFSSTPWLDCMSSMQHAVPIPLRIPRFPGLGFESQSRQFFRFFSFSQLSATVNQWRKFFLKNFIDWLIWVVIGVTSQKIALTGIRTPDLENVEFEVELELPQHAGEEKRESALWWPIASHSVAVGVCLNRKKTDKKRG